MPADGPAPFTCVAILDWADRGERTRLRLIEADVFSAV